jgi:hypothetical protein
MSRLSLVLPRAAAAGAVFATFALAGCTEPVSSPREIAPDAASFTQNLEFNDPSGRHVFHTKPWHENEARNDAGRGKPTGGGNTGISFHGGLVLQPETRVAAIYWASSTIFNGGPAVGATGAGSGDHSIVGEFMNNLGGSAYFNINSTYWDASNKNIANIVRYTQYYANGTSVPASGASVSDAQMLSMLQTAFNTGKLTYDAGTLYAIFTGLGVNLGGGFGTQYCAYHYHGTITVGGVSRVVLYAAMPYNNTYPGTCTNRSKSPNNDDGADAEVNTLAHEIEETTTDGMGNAWFDVRGYENADKCAWIWGSTYTTPNGGVANVKIGARDYLVQQNWVNSGSGGCASAYTAP